MSNKPITKDQAANSIDLLRIIVNEVVELNSSDYGICPFHDETKTSFNIFKAKSGRARFHCFGCGTTGDIFEFLKRTKKLNFAASIAYLSELIGRPIYRDLHFPLRDPYLGV